MSLSYDFSSSAMSSTSTKRLRCHELATHRTFNVPVAKADRSPEKSNRGDGEAEAPADGEPKEIDHHAESMRSQPPSAAP